MAKFINNELERIWKEVTVACSRYFGTCQKGVRRPVRTASVLAEIRTEHLPNTTPEQ
jgi:hypothetical protein